MSWSLLSPQFANLVEGVVRDPQNWQVAWHAVQEASYQRAPASRRLFAEFRNRFDKRLYFGDGAEGLAAAALAFAAVGDDKFESALVVLLHKVPSQDWLGLILRVAQQGEKRIPPHINDKDRFEYYLNYGNAYAQWPESSRSENQDHALRCFEHALGPLGEKVPAPRERDSAAAAERRTLVFQSMGNVYSERLRGDPAENRKKAKDYHEKALAEWDANAGSIQAEDRAMLLMNLANAWRDLDPVKGANRWENIKIACGQFELAAKLLPTQSLDWADVQRNLASTLLQLEDGNEIHHHRKAITALNAAAALYRADLLQNELATDSRRWLAMTLNLLGNAHSRKFAGTMGPFDLPTARENFTKSIAEYCILKNRRELVGTCFNAGCAELDNGLPDLALPQFRAAIEVVEQEFQANYTECSRTAWLQRNMDCYEGFVLSCAQLAKEKKGLALPAAGGAQTYADLALLAMERARANNLADWMNEPSDATEFPPASAPSETSIRARWRALNRRLRDVDHQLNYLEKLPPSGANSELSPAALDLFRPAPADSEKLAGDLRRRRRTLVNEIRHSSASLKSASRALPRPLEMATLQKLVARANRAVVSLRATQAGLCAIHTPRSGPTKCEVFPALAPQCLKILLERWHDAYARFNESESVPPWSNEIESVMLELGDLVGGSLAQWLMDTELAQDAGARDRPLMVVPGPELNLLPWHAVQCGDSKLPKRIGDVWELTYIASLRVWQACLDREDRFAKQPSRLLALRDPAARLRSSLPFFGPLCDEVARLFDETLMLDSSQCATGIASKPRLTGFSSRTQELPRTEGELERWETILCATHGLFHAQDPWDRSGLKVAAATSESAEALISVADLFELDLSRAWLVVLCACATALTDRRDFTGEQVGLPSALLGAGATTVIGSLWPVAHGPTALLVLRFFELLKSPTGSKAQALSQAQQWLRTRTAPQLKSAYSRLGWDGFQSALDFPYDNPFYWSGLVCYGAA